MREACRNHATSADGRGELSVSTDTKADEYHYQDDRDEPCDDDPACPCCHGDGMDPMTDYALPCQECGDPD